MIEFMFARHISAIARIRKPSRSAWQSLMSMLDTKRAVYPSSDTAKLTLGRHGLNPDVRPYRGTDHIRAQIHKPCMLALGLNATKQSSTLRWQLSTHAISLDINEEVNHSPA